jgi:hypothetical protein
VSGKTDAPLWFGAGGSALELYRRFGGGADLFRAYLNRRDADRQKANARREEKAAMLQTAPPLGADYMAALNELIMSHILEELDPLIRDLLNFCDSPQPVDDQLPDLRQALRIGRGQSPHAIALARQREDALLQWNAAYQHMHNTMTLQSDRAIAHEIAEKLGITPRAAWGYWDQLKKAAPSIAESAQQIRASVKRRPPASSHLSTVPVSVKANCL